VTGPLIFERVVGESPETVFDAFTSDGGQRAFYGNDAPGWVIRHEADVRVDGAWTIDFGPSPDEIYRHHHVFEAIERPQRLLLATTETRFDGTILKFETEFRFEAHGVAGVRAPCQLSLGDARVWWRVGGVVGRRCRTGVRRVAGLPVPVVADPGPVVEQGGVGGRIGINGHTPSGGRSGTEGVAEAAEPQPQAAEHELVGPHDEPLLVVNVRGSVEVAGQDPNRR
jgi:uncharacterized protein YndB with AHSA1/START domain